jgi:hypothetical protein
MPPDAPVTMATRVSLIFVSGLIGASFVGWDVALISEHR